MIGMLVWLGFFSLMMCCGRLYDPNYPDDSECGLGINLNASYGAGAPACTSATTRLYDQNGVWIGNRTTETCTYGSDPNPVVTTTDELFNMSVAGSGGQAAPPPRQEVLTPLSNAQTIVDPTLPANAGAGQSASTNRPTKIPRDRPQPDRVTDPTDALVDPLVKVVRPLIGN